MSEPTKVIDARPCTKCGQPVDPQRDGWKSSQSPDDGPVGIQHVTCPMSPEMAALPTVALPEPLPPTSLDALCAAVSARIIAQLADAAPVFLTPSETADLLRVHRNTISNYIQSGALPAKRVPGGRNILIDRRDALGLLEPVAVEENVPKAKRSKRLLAAPLTGVFTRLEGRDGH